MATWVSGFSTEVYTQQSLARAFLQGTYCFDLFYWAEGDRFPFFQPGMPWNIVGPTTNVLLSVGLVKKISASWVLVASACDKLVKPWLLSKLPITGLSKETLSRLGNGIVVCCKVVQVASLYLTCRSMYGQPKHFIAVILPVLIFPMLSKVEQIVKSKDINGVYHSLSQAASIVLLMDNSV